MQIYILFLKKQTFSIKISLFFKKIYEFRVLFDDLLVFYHKCGVGIPVSVFALPLVFF